MRRIFHALLLLAPAVAYAQTIFTVAGLPYSHRASLDSKPALDAPLNSIYGLLIDKLTNRLLLHDETLVTRLEPDGTLIAIAGMGRGSDGSKADGTFASGLLLSTLRGMAQDATGALYLSDASGGRVYRIGLDGIATIFAGGGAAPAENEGGRATDAALPSPRGLVFDSKGNLNIAEAYCHCLRRVSPAGIISTPFSVPQEAGFFQYFEGLAIDGGDNIYGTEFRGSVLWKIAADGSSARIAGTGVPGFSGDGGPAAAAQLNQPSGVTVDSAGSLYIADTGNNRVRRIAPDGIISTIAGTGNAGFAGDGGPAISAQLSSPAQTAIDSAGNLYISDYSNRRVRVISPSGIITTVAGSGVRDLPPFTSAEVGDGRPALNAAFNSPSSAVFSPSGDLYIADTFNTRIRKIGPDGVITTVAGGPSAPFTPGAIARDNAGALYFTGSDSRVYQVLPGGSVQLFAGMGTGTGLNRSGGDGGPATSATLNEPRGLAIDARGNVFIADTSNARLRRVDPNGTITTVAGPGIQGTDYWNAVAFDPQGNLYVGITHAAVNNSYSVIDRVNADGSLTPVAGSGQSCSGVASGTSFAYDGAQVSQVPLCVLIGFTFDPQGVLYIPESFYGSILRVSQDGTVRRIAGLSTASDSGDGGPALLANLQGPSTNSLTSIAIDLLGNLVIPQAGMNRIREIMPGPITVSISPQTLQVTANVREPLPFQAKASATWLTLNRVTGQTGDTLAYITHTAGLAPGTYSANIEVSLANGANARQPITLMVKP